MLTISKAKATFFLSSTSNRKEKLFYFQCNRTCCKTAFWTPRTAMVISRTFSSTKEIYHVFIVFSILGPSWTPPQDQREDHRKETFKRLFWPTGRHNSLCHGPSLVLLSHKSFSCKLLLLVLCRLFWRQSWLGNASFWNTQWGHAS